MSMKKLLLVFIFMLGIACLPSLADDSDLLNINTDIEQNFNIESLNNNDKQITDEDFEKAIEQVDKKVNKWKNWAQKRKIPKGQEYRQSNESEEIKNETGDKATLPVICVPMDLAFGQGTIPVGHYQVKGIKDDETGNVELALYQGHYLIAKFPAYETTEDFDEEEILFARLIFETENRAKLIYGSLDFNAYAYLRYLHN